MLDSYIQDEDLGTDMITDGDVSENYDNYPYAYNPYIYDVPEEENLQGLQIDNPKIAFWTAVAAIGLSAVALVVSSSKHKSEDLTTRMNPENFGDYEPDESEDWEDSDESDEGDYESDENDESDEPDQENEDWVE